MLSGGLDPTYRAALAGPHTLAVRVDVHDGSGNLLQSDIPILGGGVTANLASRVTRNLNLTLSEEWYPWSDDDLLAPWGNEIRAYRGVEYGDGLKIVFPIFRGKIQSCDMSTGGTCEVDAADLAQDLEDADFLLPYNSSAGVNVLTQFKELVTDAMPGAEFGASSQYRETMPPLTWESGRGQALDEVASGAGSYWYALPDGRFVMRRVPWTVAGSPTVTLTDKPGGLLLEALPRKSREGVYNSVTAVAERTDGSAPAYAWAEDDVPSSRTYAGGAFGRKHRLIRVQAAATQQAAAGFARGYVARARALAETWSWSQIPDPAMELGEVVGLEARGRTGIVQVVASFQMPLTVGGQMTVSARSQMIGSVGEDV